jgi:hypothetical protein
MAITINEELPSGMMATYARPLASSSLRLDTGSLELTVALYKDAAARFAGKDPADYDRKTVMLTDQERSGIAAIIYGAMARDGLYPNGQIRDPDPEKLV